MNTVTLNAPIAEDMRAVDAVIRTRLQSEVVLVSQVAEYIISAGGKRMRPALVLLGARACGYQGTHHHDLAAVVEFIHTATLLHDDVVDESSLRRGRETANAVFGNDQILHKRLATPGATFFIAHMFQIFMIEISHR